jgi:hypothetical protein
LPSPFEYALLRVVPRVERGEFVNAGVVLYCQEKRFLEAAIDLDPERLRVLDPRLDPETVRAHLEAARRVCAGGPGAGPSASCRPSSGSGGSWRPGAPSCSRAPSTPASPKIPRQALDHLLRTMVKRHGRGFGFGF